MSVYFIQCNGDEGPVKIGYSTKPKQRLADLQCANPYPLRMLRLLDGARTVERGFHRHYAALRVGLEWFSFCPTMLTVEVADIAPVDEPVISIGMQLLRAERGRCALVARSLGITTAAVAMWDKIPAERIPEIEKATGISRYVLRPDLWDRAHP